MVIIYGILLFGLGAIVGYKMPKIHHTNQHIQATNQYDHHKEIEDEILRILSSDNDKAWFNLREINVNNDVEVKEVIKNLVAVEMIVDNGSVIEDRKKYKIKN